MSRIIKQTMANCSYKTTLDSGEEWKCPCEALPGEELCYWHKKEEGKEPTQEMLEELKEREIFGVYLEGAKLQHANLYRANLQNANLMRAKLQNADLRMAKLQNAEIIGAKMENANLMSANLHDSNLIDAEMGNAYLRMAKMRNAYLNSAELHNADLGVAELHNADLYGVNLQKANLERANLQKANIKEASLQGTYLYGVRFDSETALDGSKLYDANLFRSYFDEAKSFRNTDLFRTETDKEINELIGDALRDETTSVLDIDKIEKKDQKVAAAILNNEGLVKYARDSRRIVFFDRSSGGIRKNPENRRRREDDTVIIDGLSDVIVKDGAIQSEYLYDGSRADQFEASYEVYNNLYNFYVNNGRLDQAARVHYRREEVRRKLFREQGGFKWLRSWLFDCLVLRLMAGYGDRIERPTGASATIIAVFAVLFWLTNGIVKNVNGKIVPPGWRDYIYHSITTFTSLGYSNIQPNLNSTAGPWPQIFVSFESVLGILLMALIIFVVTYQVSR